LILLFGDRYGKVIMKNFIFFSNYTFIIGEENLLGIKFEQAAVVRILICGQFFFQGRMVEWRQTCIK
jgi:hypothetical protein